jgi:hypothetical protein
MSSGGRGWGGLVGVLLLAACGSSPEPETARTAPETPEQVEARPEEGSRKTQVLFRWSEVQPGAQCALGGTTIQSGADANGNGVLEDEEVTQTSSTCHGAIHTEVVAGTQVLLRLDPEPVGANCEYGGTRVRNGVDNNGDGTLQLDEVVQTQFVCSSMPPYPSNWANSSLNGISSGLTPVGVWMPTGRKATLFKKNPASRLKITVSDNLMTGYSTNGGYGYYEVRMNGGRMAPACYQAQFNGNSSAWANTYYFPFSTVCLTDVLPAGLYEFDTWVYGSVGQASVGSNSTQALLLVEEIEPTSNYGYSTEGGAFSNVSTAFQRAPGRTVSFSKQLQGTLLKVTLADTLRTGLSQNGGYGTVMIRLDGVDTSCYTTQYDAQGTGGNIYTPFVMTCVLPNVSAGSHNFSVWLRADSGGAYLGWERPAPLLMIEELVNQTIAYSTATAPSGELGGDWSGVAGRWLTHTVSSSEKTLKVTYSDTFRAAAGCNSRWGFIQLYVDNQPFACSNGQYASISGTGATHNHHHPVNQVCLVKDLPPGPHTFAIWSTTRDASGTCGTNYFGWNRGQSLLMLEELP